MRLRSHLVLLVLAAVLPLLVFALVIVRQDLVERREIVDRGMRNTVRALSLAIDGEVKTSFALLETLAASPFLDRGDTRPFHELARRAMQGRNGYVTLFDDTGKPLLNSSRPYGAALPNPVVNSRPAGADARYPEVPLGGGDPVSQVLRRGTTVVSGVFISLVTGTPRIAFEVPVIRQGGVRYVLEMSLDAEELTRVLLKQHVPADTVLAIVDRNGVAVARTLNAAERVGRRLAPELDAQIGGAASGSGTGRTSEGLSVYHVFTRSPFTGWTTSLSVARSIALAPLSDAVASLVAGATIAVLLALLAALFLGRRLAEPISALAAAAGTLARGERSRLDVSAVSELAHLHDALVSAGDSMRQAALEREARLAAEAKEAQAGAASRAKDEFLAMLSHELRNPLAALTSSAHVLRVADPASAASIKARLVVERQTKHMSRLVGDLLDVSRITYGKLALNRDRLDLGEVVARLVNVWRASGRFERHHVSLDVESAWVDADRARMEQIAANLLDNALKFTPTGKRVAISVRREQGSALLRVVDEGPGVPAEERGRIFELFEQAGPAGKGGLGIGLALVKQLADLHGGSVSLESPGPGQGAVFTVRLPAVEAPAPQELAPLPRATQGRAVLIVDDNEDARQMLVTLLHMAGHAVRAAADGRTGLALAHEIPPDVALIDIRLPDMEGYEVARRLRTAHDGRRMSLIALSGFGRSEDERRALDAGFDVHLLKPVTAERLRQVMEELQ